jgi:hypothetical protein
VAFPPGRGKLSTLPEPTASDATCAQPPCLLGWLGQRHGAALLLFVLTALVAILMALNSNGVDGLRSRAHIQHALPAISPWPVIGGLDEWEMQAEALRFSLSSWLR